MSGERVERNATWGPSDVGTLCRYAIHLWKGCLCRQVLKRVLEEALLNCFQDQLWNSATPISATSSWENDKIGRTKGEFLIFGKLVGKCCIRMGAAGRARMVEDGDEGCGSGWGNRLGCPP